MKIAASLRQIGFYASRLRKEKVTRFVIMSTASLALVLQLTAGVFPLSQSSDAHATAATPGDNIIYQGVTSKADMLAVYDRNVDAAGHRDIQQIYTQLGVTRADIANTTMGSYYTNDFGGKINTLSRMKWPIPGRTPIAVAGTNTTIYTGPFADNNNHNKIEELALIGKRASDGQWFAITIHCGNLVYVVPPKPKPKPAAACVSLTIEKISRTSLNIIAKATTSNGATVKAYHYVVSKDGKVLTDRVIPTTGLGSQINQGYETGTYTAKVSVQTSLGELTSPNCTKTFTIPPAPVVPVYTCDSLTVKKVTRTSFTFDTKYTVKDATFKSVTYVITDASGKEIARTTNPNYTQVKEGAYAVKAIVTVTVNGVDKIALGTDCEKSFEVKPVPVTPVYTCDSLTFTKINRTDASFTGTASAAGGAEIVSYTFTFGDGSSKTVTNPTDVVHSYAQAGTYITKLAVTVKVNGETKTVTNDSDCVAKVTVSPEECLPGIPVGDERCTPPVEECKPGIPVGDERCAPPVTPPELPHTGAGGVAGSVLGLGSVIASLGYYISSRRGLLSALLNR